MTQVQGSDKQLKGQSTKFNRPEQISAVIWWDLSDETFPACSYRYCKGFAQALHPLLHDRESTFFSGASQDHWYQKNTGWHVGKSHGRSGNWGCTLGPGRELGELGCNGGRNPAPLQISSQNEAAGRAAVLALKGSSVSNRQQLSRPIANS